MTQAPFVRPGVRRRRFGVCPFHSLHTKKGLRGNNRTYTSDDNKPGNVLISAHGGIINPIPPLVQPEQRGAERWRRNGCFSMFCCKTKHKSEDNIANSGQNTAQIWIISTKAPTYSHRRISRANNRQKMDFHFSGREVQRWHRSFRLAIGGF